MGIVDIQQAERTLSSLVDRAAAGEEIVIAKAGKPLARLVGLASAVGPRKPGLLRDKISIRKDFDDPLPDELLDAFAGHGRQE